MQAQLQRYKLSEGVLSVNTAGEEVLMDYASGKYFGLRGAITVVLDALRSGTDLPAMSDLVSQHFRVSREIAEGDLAPILQRLVETGLVQAIEAA